MAFDRRQMAAFLAIVARGSLGRAAEALHITQPALSRTLMRLESQVGAALFDRHPKGMLLTPIGAALLPHARLLQHEYEVAIEEIDALRGLAKGTIKVGTIGTATAVLLPLALSDVLTRWPLLRANVVEGVGDRLREALMSYEIDVALDEEKPDTDEICAIADCRWEDRSAVVAATGHPLQRRRGLHLADTLTERWTVPPRGTAPFEHMRRTFAAHGLGLPNVVVESRSITVLKGLITRGGFLCWMAEPIFDAERAAGQIAPLPLPETSSRRSLAAFRRRQGTLPAPAVKLVEALRRLTLKDLGGPG